MTDKIKRKVLKLAMLGDSTVGKTSICNVYFNNDFENNQLMTIGQVKMDGKIKMEDGTELKLIIWDTAGQERFHSISLNACKNAEGIIVTFDLTKPKTFQNITEWLNKINENITNIPIIILGNKCDLEKEREVTKEEAENFAKNLNLPYFETSAKENINIKESIEAIANIAYKKAKDKAGFNLEENKLNQDEKGGCCGSEKNKKKKSKE